MMNILDQADKSIEGERWNKEGTWGLLCEARTTVLPAYAHKIVCKATNDLFYAMVFCIC